MKKSTLIRSDKPHAVKMAEGTNVAQRKNVKKSGTPDAPDEPADNIQKLTPVKTAKTDPIPVPDPVKTVRAKTQLRQAQTPAKPAKPRASTAKTSTKTPTKAEPVWEQDNPIKSRIEKLKTRNAQLAEQLQRLQHSPTARGQRP